MASAIYQLRKEQGLCTRCGGPSTEGSQYCEPHLQAHRLAAREHKQRLTKRRRRAKVCVQCGRRRRAGDKLCLRCRVGGDRVRRIVEGNAVDVQVDKAARLASMTRKDAGNRTRYHGQGKRGMQPRIQLDGQDLEYARRAITAGEAGLKAFESDEAKAMPRIQREDVKHAALHHLQRAQGHIEDVLERRGHFKVRHGRRDGE